MKMSGILSKRPSTVFIPALAFWLALNVPPWPWSKGTDSILRIMVSWSTIGLVQGTDNSVFPFTLGSAIISFIFAFSRLNRVRLTRMWRFLLASSFPFAFTGAFEFIYRNSFLLVRPEAFGASPLEEVLSLSWIFLGISTVHYWRAGRFFYPVFASLIVCFGIWLVVGYPQIYDTTGVYLWYAFPLNVATKILFALLFIVLLYEGTLNPPTGGAG